MISTIYFLSFIASLLMTGSFLHRNKKIDTLYMFFGLLIVTTTFGRYMISVSQTLEMAILANKILYIGASFLPIAIALILNQLCNLKMPNILKFFMMIFSIVLYGFALTVGKYPYYYKTVTLKKEYDYYYIEKTYGPMHALFPYYMIFTAGIIIYFLVYAIIKRKQMSIKTISTISLLSFSVVFAYVLEQITHSHISFLSFGYLIATILMTNLFQRLNMYDMSSNIAASINKMGENGYIILDNKMRYISANSLALSLFPEINREWRVDSAIPKCEGLFSSEIYEWLNEKSKSSKTIHVNESYFEIKLTNIPYLRNSCVGYMIEITDRTEENKYLYAIENYNTNLKNEVEIKTADISHIKDMMVLGMSSMVESRDNSTGGHIKRTSKVVAIFSKELLKYKDELNLSEEFLSLVTKAAPMHDLGKIAINDQILRKNGKFTDEEYTEMKRHSAEGAKIVKNILSGVENDDFVTIAVNVAHFHHEKWDGNGYPNKISGMDIPIEARIMALADVFDALVSKRCYKEAFSYDKAFEIIDDSLGSHFDPELGKIFINCRSELEELYNTEACRI